MIASYRRTVVKTLALAATAACMAGAAPWALAADEAPDAMIQRLSDDVLATIRSDKTLQGGDVNRVMAVVDSKVMPNVNFTRMTASATGPNWRKATPEQRQKLQQEFTTLLVHTYAGALRQVSDQSVEVRPLRAAPGDKEVVVRTLVKGRGEPVQAENVDMVGLQPLQAGFDRLDDVLAHAVRAGLRHRLGADHQLGARVLADQPVADDALALAAGVARHPARVAIGGVEKVAAQGFARGKGDGVH